MDRKKVLLIITDGIGYNQSCDFNAFCQAKKPTYDYLFKNVPNSLIKTYGKYVGLPDGQMGNSEVGHMSIGSGRVLYQDLVKIDLAIKDGSLKENKVLNKVINNSNNIHLIGLVSDGGVHSHIEHLKGLINILKEKNKKIFIHIITDGRDVAFDSAKKYIKEILSLCNDNIIIGSVGGRYYGMDRDKNYDRIEKAYLKLVSKGNQSYKDILSYIDSQYEKDIFDEFIEPISFKELEPLKENDGVIFFNFRSDRARQLSKKLYDENKYNIATMTEYDKNTPIDIIFPKEIPTNTLAEVISKNNLRQFHTAETEKYAHVTFFFNGGREEPFENEDRVLVPSPKVATYDKKPEMSAKEVADEVIKAIDKEYDFIVVNFANGDMVGHTGVYEAAIKAVESVDRELGRILDKAKDKYSVILTSDHGNCEKMRDENGNILTNHTIGDVFCFVIDKDIKQIDDGKLSNIAPSVLKLMGLSIPEEMDKPLF